MLRPHCHFFPSLYIARQPSRRPNRYSAARTSSSARVMTPMSGQERLERGQPSLVVRRLGIGGVRRGDLVDEAGAELVPLVEMVVAQHDRHAEGTPSQGASKTNSPFLRGSADGPSISPTRSSASRHHSASAGALTVATPIMASRVTSAANSSSESPSVPAGRSGSTM